MTTHSRPLTETQKKKIVAAYKSGTTKYSDISKELEIPYGKINKFMTKWKRENGELPELPKTRSLEVRPANLIPQSPRLKEVLEGTGELTDMEELSFLRKFYAKHIFGKK